jgi:hypothetical protein
MPETFNQSATLAQTMQTFSAMLCIVESLSQKMECLSERIERIYSRQLSGPPFAFRDKLEREFYTLQEIAEIIGTSDKTVRRLQKRGFFKSNSALRTNQIPSSEIERYKAETA